MPGIRIVRGAQLRVRDISVSVNESGASSLEVGGFDLRMDMWPFWLEECLAVTVEAGKAKRQLAEVLGADPRDEDAITACLTDELRASLRAITAAAFAYDAFYSSVRARAGAHPDQQK